MVGVTSLGLSQASLGKAGLPLMASSGKGIMTVDYLTEVTFSLSLLYKGKTIGSIQLQDYRLANEQQNCN